MGTAFYGDYDAQTIRRLIFGSDGKVASTAAFATGSTGMVDLESGPTGNLVLVDIGTFNDDGVIREIVYSPNREPKAVATATPRSGTAPAERELRRHGIDGSRQRHPELRLGLRRRNGTFVGLQAFAQLFPGGGLHRNAHRDRREGRPRLTTMQITPGESRPTATISAPLDESTYRDGAAIDLAGSATDAQDGGLDGSQLEWKIVLHHDTHIHPGATKTGTSASFTASTDHDADSYYEVTLTATDSAGLKSIPRPSSCGRRRRV